MIIRKFNKLKLGAENYLSSKGWFLRNNKNHYKNRTLVDTDDLLSEIETKNVSAVKVNNFGDLTSENNYRELQKINLELEKQQQKYVKSNEILKLRNEALTHQREVMERQRNALASQREAGETHREVIGKLRKQVNSLQEFEPLRKQTSFLNQCLANLENIQAEAYVAHEVLPLLAASFLSEEFSSKLMCNVVEIPSFKDRGGNITWDSAVLKIINDQVSEQLRSCDQLITVGPTLAKEIQALNEKVCVIPNYRYKEKIQFSDELRKRCDLKKSDKLVLAISTISSGFEAVLESFASLPENIHLVTMGKFFPREYEQQIKKVVKERGLSQRIHFFEAIEYRRLTSVSSAADLGLIILDPLIKNHHVSLPNRIFDYISSELPIVSPEIPDISHYITEYNIGEVLPDTTPSAWSNAIIKCLNQTEVQKNNIKELKNEITWESLESKFLELFDDIDSITFLGLNKLASNNRTLRMARSLLQHGKKVVICSVGDKSEVTLTDNNLEYVFFEKL